ncbi:uncharacterized protein [Nothobranchius furzeri]|uniref:uncharacterized protein isoform X7 n=1 Tax=Nothobranchius furzeri TaxID=105023 RepID=UPI003904771C
MMAKRPKRVKMKPKDEAVQFLALGKDKDGFDVKFINSFKGRGVFSTCHFEKGSFLVEYRGEVINKLEYEDRLRIYHDAMKVFMFEFRHNGKLMCVDASREDDSLGRLVNDDHVSPNSKMKTITVNGQPHLCLFAIKDIKPGEEITYDYGNSDWPWRLKVTSLTDAAKADEPLASKQDIQVTSLYDAANADEPLATLSSKQDTQVTSLYDAANADEPLATLSSKQDTQVTSLYDAANADEPLATLSSKQDTQVTSLYDAANADEPLATLSSKQDTQVTSLYDATNADEPLATLSSKQDTQVTSLTDAAKADEPLASKQDIQVLSHTDVAEAVTVASPLSTQDIQSCKHVLCPSSMTSMEKCVHCLGPYSARKWDGVKCRVCSSIWHEKCFNNTMRDSSLVSEESDPSDEVSEEEYVPDSVSSSSDSDKLSDKKLPQREQFEVQEEEMSLKTTARTEDAENIQSSSVSSTEKKNYCFVCDKPQSKLARHFQVHEKTHAEVAEVLALPINSKMRKLKLDRLRNKGNCKHNSEVYKSGSGLLKIKRKPKKIYDLNQYVHCTYCQGLYLRKHFWRHAHKCKAKPLQDEQESGRVLTLASMVDSSLCQQISQSVWKLLSVMRDDEVATAVRSDFNILQLAQSFFNKHGQDPTKHEYIRQKIREVGRLLLILRKDYSVYNLEEAVRPSNFHTLVQAVKKVSGFDEEKHSFQTPSLALKLGHSLHKICDIINCKALMTGDCELKKSTQAFKKLYSTKWSELVSHTALTTLDDKHFNKPSTLPFTEDVKRLHQHLEKVGNSASETLKCDPSPQAYGELCKTTLSKIILFNRRRGGEVSKMHLSAFAMRDTSPLHKDVALGLSQFEQKLCAHFSRVEIKGKRGRKVAVLLSPDMVEAINILISRRQECGVPQKNPFLFARPHCLTPFRAQDCLRLYSNQCGAQRPDLLRSTQLRKHVATLSQVLNLKNHELDQVADFLGHDIRVHREYYRLPEATTQLAKISKLLIALDKGALSDLQGKTLEEIEIEDELDLTDSDGGEESETEELTECSTNEEPSEPPGTRDESKRAREPVDDISGTSKDVDSPGEGTSQAFPDQEAQKKRPRRIQKRPWSPKEVAAVMKYFSKHINTGKLASFIEIEQCKKAEYLVLKGRSPQNIRDFVRNRGKAKKKS